MAKELWTNFAKSTLRSAITSGATSIPLAVGTGALFPNPSGSDYFRLVLDDGVNWEIANIAARSTDDLTAVRAQEGTTARAFAAGTVVRNDATAATLELLRAPTSTLYISNGGISTGISYTTAATYNCTEADSMIFLDPTSNAITVNIFDATGKPGRQLNLMRITGGANLVTIVPFSPQTIIGQANYVLKNIWESLMITTTTSHWYPIASHSYENSQLARVASNVTTTLATVVDVTALSFFLNSNEIWMATYELKVSCGTGGVKFAINGPAGATLVMQVFGGASATVTAFTSSQVTALNTLTTEGYAVSATRQVTVTATILGGATAGSVQLRFASLTSGQTSTIFANSSMVAMRLSA